jgi:hypothetical protein
LLADAGLAAPAEWTANIAPLGSITWAMRPPPGTSIGPAAMRPPAAVAAVAAASALATDA